MKISLSIITFVLLIQFAIYSQNGEELYNKNCKACHSIGQGKLVGPDLINISERRSEDWIIKFTIDSKSLINSGDKQAVEIFEEFNKMPMPNQNLTQIEIKSILDYIKKLSGNDTDSTLATNTIDDISFSENSIDSGALYFTGNLRFINGGQNCTACHTISDERVFSGGNLAKDLSTSYKNLNYIGIKTMLQSPPFPAMNEVYKDNKLTDKEIHNLIAFLKYSGESPSRPKFGFINSKFLMYSILLFFIILSTFGIYWGTGKFRSTNKEILDR